MATKSRRNKPSHPSTFKIGSRVRVRIGLTDWLGAIVEDRGFIGVGRRRLWTVKLDSDSDPENERYIELPEAEMTLVE